MSTYAIGDIQGCYDELRRLLDKAGFDPTKDKLWCVGDLVNRGPDSLAVVRWIKALGERAVVVLGNHDLHLLAVALADARLGKKDTLDAILAAPDRDELLHWLRHRPLLHHSEKKQFTMLHAGLPPQWDLAQARACARELEDVLRGPDHVAFLRRMYGNEPGRWSDDLSGLERLRFIVNCFTRLRWCTADGELLLQEKGDLEQAGPGALPWFRVPGRRTRDDRLLFGHWSTIGFLAEHNCWALDSGCVWGGRLSAVRVRRKKPLTLIQLDCAGYLAPG
ncbi:MAG: symmetrical bis(5'-nucleosyl)-tetraphosphatase [Halochromatium sp.]|uniref:symmetrical bis(5'-nucleosyl)-tetraphosphatase n=1 Tax=Halochromatium sp. TaxID=2049430 RepID=UPI00397A00CA